MQKAWRGQVIHVEEQETYLERGDHLEENYFTWSTIPIKSCCGDVEGLMVPNFERTAGVISNRRMSTLHNISNLMTNGVSTSEIIESALKGIATNPKDLNFALVYSASLEKGHVDTASQAERVQNQANGLVGSLASGQVTSTLLTPLFASTGDRAQITFKFAGSTGCVALDDSGIPNLVTSQRSVPQSTTREKGLAKAIRDCHIKDEVVILHGQQVSSFQACLRPNLWGEIPTHVAVMPIRASADNAIYGVLVVGLSTRLRYDEPYAKFFDLVRSLIGNGHAAIQLHREVINRSNIQSKLEQEKSSELERALHKKTLELREAELKFTAAFQISPTGIWIATPEGEMQYVNEEFRKFMRMKPGSAASQWDRMVHPEDKERIMNNWYKCRQGKVRSEFRLLLDELDVNGEREVRYIESTGMPYCMEEDSLTNKSTGSKKIAFCTGALIDVTERKREEMFQHRRADDATAMRHQLEEFIDFSSHEIRNPLSAIGMSIDHVRELLEIISPDTTRSDCVDEAYQGLDVVRMCLTHMQRLVDDVLLLSKIDSDMWIIMPCPCNPVHLADRIITIASTEMSRADIACKLTVTPRLTDLVDHVMVDPDRTSQILMNLLNNAIKFTKRSLVRDITVTVDASLTIPNGSVYSPELCASERRVQQDKSIYLIYSVQDTGPGIAPEDAEQLFQRFRQGFRTSVTYGGSGLGLYICRKLTQKLGGDVLLETEQGTGSTFTFYIKVERCGPPTPSSARDLDDAGPHSLLHRSLAQEPHAHTTTSPMVSQQQPSTGMPRSLVGVCDETFSPIHVLVTEDNIVNQTLLRKQLVRLGFDVQVANTGLEAVTLAKSSSICDPESPFLLDCILMGESTGGAQHSRAPTSDTALIDDF